LWIRTSKDARPPPWQQVAAASLLVPRLALLRRGPPLRSAPLPASSQGTPLAAHSGYARPRCSSLSAYSHPTRWTMSTVLVAASCSNLTRDFQRARRSLAAISLATRPTRRFCKCPCVGHANLGSGQRKVAPCKMTLMPVRPYPRRMPRLSRPAAAPLFTCTLITHRRSLSVLCWLSWH
jgi:hypothetical protein